MEEEREHSLEDEGERRRLERIEARSWSGGKEEKGVNVEGEREGRRQKIRQRKIVVGSFV